MLRKATLWREDAQRGRLGVGALSGWADFESTLKELSSSIVKNLPNGALVAQESP
jgi:hypothetical protein